MTYHSDAQQRTEAWYEARKGLVTGSVAGAILGLDPNRSCHDVMRQLVRDYCGAEREFEGNVATQYGTFNEPGAIFEYEMEMSAKVQPCGFFQREWLGASPDGLVGDFGLIEVKCPYRMRDGGLEHKKLSEQPHYYAQVQIELYVTQREWCDFVQWSPDVMTVERVKPDHEWLDKNLPQLYEFYLLFCEQRQAGKNAEYLEPKRKEINSVEAQKLIDEYAEVCSQIEWSTKRKAELLQELVDLSGGRNSIVCGMNLTRVEREGSVSYQKVVAKYLPDLDLNPFRGKPTQYWRLS